MKSNSGGIRERGENVWQVRLDQGRDANGARKKPLCETVHGTRKDADLVLARMKIMSGTMSEVAESITVSQFWYVMYRPSIGKLAQSTLRGYDSAWRVHIEPMFGDREIATLKTYEIDVWVNSFDKPGAARSAYKTMRQMLRRAYGWGTIQYDPTSRGINLPKIPTYEAAVYDLDDVRTVLRGIRGERVEPIVLVMLGGGARREESTALFWPDIEFREIPNFADKTAAPAMTAYAHIDKGWQYLGGETVETPLKTEKSHRVLALAAPFSTRLYELKKDSGPLVPALDDATKRENPDKISEEWKDLCKRKGMPYIEMKNLRHSFATVMQSIGTDSSIIASMLGHADNSMTAYKHYLKPKVETFMSAADKLGKAIGE